MEMDSFMSWPPYPPLRDEYEASSAGFVASAIHNTSHWPGAALCDSKPN